ncbi:MAG: glycerol-3-phosphate dehydrogenase/oxidase [Acidobacteriales bacterium]|nr:glycerol-3-phosphate dehydrogenase/oxidase [Terriglobales bacterium]
MTRRRGNLDGERFDVAVIGGGINGVAIARECARAGRRTLLLEQHDFASGTTSRATRIIHGGLRYLEHGEIGLVRDALRERQRLLHERPHLVKPLTFVLALQAGARHSALAIRTGLWLYRAYARQKEGSPEQLSHMERLLDGGHKWALFAYQDAQCEFPERLVAEWLAEAVEAGAVVRNYASAMSVEVQHGRVRTISFRDTLCASEQRIETSWLINASGPWADFVCQQLNVRTAKPLVSGVRGSHIVLSAFPGSPQAAVYSEAADARPFFVVPWNGQLLVGSTEVTDAGNPSTSQPSSDEIEYLLASVRRLFPKQRFDAADIRYAFSGVRPLPYAPGHSASAITRKHVLHDHAHDGVAGMISVLGGKLTTALSVARECVRKLGINVPEPPSPLIAAALGDGVLASYRQWAQQVARLANISEDSARSIAEWHGRNALQVARLASQDALLRSPLCHHSHHLVAEALVAFGLEQAATLGDALLRRVPVALGACWSAECSRVAAERVGRALSWSEQQRAQALEDFEQERQQFLQPPALERLKMASNVPFAASQGSGQQPRIV